MCVFDGKTWTFGRMLGHSVSDLQLEQTLYALWITNKTKVGQGQNRGRKRKRVNAHKPHVSPLHNGYSYRENDEIHRDSSSNSDEEDGNENENENTQPKPHSASYEKLSSSFSSSGVESGEEIDTEDFHDEEDGETKRSEGRHILYSKDIEASVMDAAVCLSCRQGKLELWEHPSCRQGLHSA